MPSSAKNISYDANEPTFLRKLRDNLGGNDISRHERPQARPKKQMKDGDEDDQPTYVVEGSHDVLSQAEYEALSKQDEPKNEANKPRNSSIEAANSERIKDQAQVSPMHQEAVEHSVAAIGASKKKKRPAKPIGNEDEEETNSAETQPARPAKNPTAKKAKKIKLSFDTEV